MRGQHGILFFPERIGVSLSRIMSGEKATEKRTKSLSLSANRVQRGKWAFWGGIYGLLMGIVLLIEIV
jgi:hypothetical protein